jgi:hypothetical protein
MTTDEPNRVRERWICKGRRWSPGKGRLYTTWLSLAADTEHAFTGVAGVVGGEYDVAVERTEDSVAIVGAPGHYLDDIVRAVEDWDTR